MILEPLDRSLVRWVRMHDRGSAVAVENISREPLIGITVLFTFGEAPSGRDRQYTHMHLDPRDGALIAPGELREFSPDREAEMRASVQALIDHLGRGFGPDRRNALERVIAEQEAEAWLIDQIPKWTEEVRDAELLRLSSLSAAPQDAFQFAQRQIARRLRLHESAIGSDRAFEVLAQQHRRKIRVRRRP